MMDGRALNRSSADNITWARLLKGRPERPDFSFSPTDERENAAKLGRISQEIERETHGLGRGRASLHEAEVRQTSELAEGLSASLLEPFVLGTSLASREDDILRGVDALLLVNGEESETNPRASVICLDATTSGDGIVKKITKAFTTVEQYGGNKVYIPDEWRDDEEFTIDGIIRQQGYSAKSLGAPTVGYIPWDFLQRSVTPEQLTTFRQLLALQLAAQAKAFARHLAMNVLPQNPPFRPPTDQSVEGLKAWFASYESRSLSPKAKNHLLLGVSYLNLTEEIASKANTRWGIVGELVHAPIVGKANDLTIKLRRMYENTVLSQMVVGTLAVALESEKPFLQATPPVTASTTVRHIGSSHHSSSQVYRGAVASSRIKYRSG